jgi:hypothetical protein
MGNDTKPHKSRTSWWTRAAHGAAGAVAPDILLLWSKRFTMPSLIFSFRLYGLATILYMLLAAVVATITVPTNRRNAAVRSFGVGVALPFIVAGLAAAARAAADQSRSPIVHPVYGHWLDVLSLF